MIFDISLPGSSGVSSVHIICIILYLSMWLLFCIVSLLLELQAR